MLKQCHLPSLRNWSNQSKQTLTVFYFSFKYPHQIFRFTALAPINKVKSSVTYHFIAAINQSFDINQNYEGLKAPVNIHLISAVGSVKFIGILLATNKALSSSKIRRSY